MPRIDNAINKIARVLGFMLHNDVAAQDVWGITRAFFIKILLAVDYLFHI